MTEADLEILRLVDRKDPDQLSLLELENLGAALRESESLRTELIERRGLHAYLSEALARIDGSLDALLADLRLDPVVHGIQMYEATDVLLRRRPLQSDVPAILWQIGPIETCLHSQAVSLPGRLEVVGDRVVVTIDGTGQVCNTGDVALTNVSVTDDCGSGPDQTDTIGSLPVADPTATPPETGCRTWSVSCAPNESNTWCRHRPPSRYSKGIDHGHLVPPGLERSARHRRVRRSFVAGAALLRRHRPATELWQRRLPLARPPRSARCGSAFW